MARLPTGGTCLAISPWSWHRILGRRSTSASRRWFLPMQECPTLPSTWRTRRPTPHRRSTAPSTARPIRRCPGTLPRHRTHRCSPAPGRPSATDQVSYMFDAGNGSNRYLVVSIALETETRNCDRGQLRRAAAHPPGGRVQRGLRQLPVRTVQPARRQQPAVRHPERQQRHRRRGLLVHRGSADGHARGVRVAHRDRQGRRRWSCPADPANTWWTAFAWTKATATLAPGTGQTERGRRTASTFEAVQSTEPGAASVTMSWTFTGAVYGWASAAVSLKPAN